MWGKFYTDKEFLKKQYEIDKWACGEPLSKIEDELLLIKEKYRGASLSKIKSEAIKMILERAEIEVNPDEFFQDKINYGPHYSSIMRSFVREGRRNAYKNFEKDFTINNSTDFGVFEAAMDFSHIAPDWEFLIKNGLVGVIDRLKEYRDKCFDEEKLEFYDNSIRVYEAMITALLRMASLAESYKSEKSKFIAENLRNVAKRAPKTLAEAMQLSLFFYRTETNLDTTVVRTLGNIDRLYYPLYRSDIESGRFTESELRELTADFLWKISAMKTPANLPLALAGKLPDGSDASNEYTRVFLEEYGKLDIFDPKIHILYHENIPRDIVDTVLHMIREGKNSFVFINQDVSVRALEKIGIAPEDAKRLTIIGCYEPMADGTEVPCTSAGYINLAKALEFALYNGVDPIKNLDFGLKTGEDFASFGEFFDAVKKQIKFISESCADAISRFEPHFMNVCPSPILSATFESSVMRGVDLYAGGAKYNNSSVFAAGIATVADSLMAIKKIVFEERRVSIKELRKILKNNWEGAEDLRLYCLNKIEKYGNNKTEVDEIALEVSQVFENTINNRKNGRGGVFRGAIFSVGARVEFGKKTGATPDGRAAFEMLSKNAVSSTGQDKAGVTSLISSILKFDATSHPDGFIADIVLHESSVKGEGGFMAFRGLLIAYMRAGGASIHFNILSPELLKKAQREPELYKNIQIRLCGWNVYFVNLRKEDQDDFIRRSSNTF